MSNQIATSRTGNGTLGLIFKPIDGFRGMNHRFEGLRVFLQVKENTSI